MGEFMGTLAEGARRIAPVLALSAAAISATSACKSQSVRITARAAEPGYTVLYTSDGQRKIVEYEGIDASLNHGHPAVITEHCDRFGTFVANLPDKTVIKLSQTVLRNNSDYFNAHICDDGRLTSQDFPGLNAGAVLSVVQHP